MDCQEAKALVEKLADGEASEREARQARSHLAGCASCRADHARFLALARAASLPLPEPPPGYFEDLPRRILARIDAEATPGSGPSAGRRFLGPGALRWGSLAAVLLAAVAVGLVVEREGLLRESSAPVSETALPSASAPAAVPPESLEEDEPLAEEAVPAAPAPPAARRAARPEVPAEPAIARDRRERSQPEEEAAASEARLLASAEAQEAGAARDELKLAQRPEAPGRSFAQADASASAASGTAGGSDCERWRLYLEETVPSGEEAREARYRLASCSIEQFRRDGTEGLRLAAIEDAEAFLGVESEGPRAEEIREALKSLR